MALAPVPLPKETAGAMPRPLHESLGAVAGLLQHQRNRCNCWASAEGELSGPPRATSLLRQYRATATLRRTSVPILFFLERTEPQERSDRSDVTRRMM
jgi:hypothetical protein